ncbi:MAG: TolC family protein [Candidatus Sumerlaeaceae bacterium]
MANQAKIPDLSAGVEVDVRASPKMWRPQLGLTLPIWRDKIKADIAAAESKKKSAEARRKQAQIELAAAIAERLFMYREATLTGNTLSQQLIPRAQQALDISRADYSAGKAQFLSVIENLKLLYSMELERVEANTRRELALAELELLVANVSPPGAPLLSETQQRALVSNQQRN